MYLSPADGIIPFHLSLPLSVSLPPPSLSDSYLCWSWLQVSDDEDDTHPNIDTPSLFRWRHQARVERMEEQKKERAVLNKETIEHRQKVAEVTRKLQEIDTAQSKETKKRLKAELDDLKKQEEEYKKKEETLAKKERVSLVAIQVLFTLWSSLCSIQYAWRYMYISLLTV